MISYRAVVEAKLAGDRKRLNEASLGRVYQHVKKSGAESYAIVTSDRASDPPRLRRAKRKRLEQMVRSMGLGFFKLVGHWRECQDPKVPYSECPPHLLVDATERALFVPGMSLAQAKKVGRRYEQDAVIYAGPETGGVVTLQFREGGSHNIGRFSPSKIAQAYSTVKGKDFVFECVAQSHVEALIERSIVCID